MSGKITPIREITPESVAPREVVSYELSTLFTTGRQPRYNPDELAGRSGLGIYSKMMLDEQVKAVMNFRLASITCRGYEFVYPQDSKLSDVERDTRIRFYQFNTERMRGSFQDAMRSVLRGHIFGFSVTEKIYDVVPFEGDPMYCFVALLPRDPQWFHFYTDRYGTLLKTEQWIGSDHIEVDIGKFIHYVRAQEEDRYYGQSDLRAAYRAWYMKGVILSLYGIYLERFAGGFAHVELAAESNITAASPEYSRLTTALSDIRNMASLIMPVGAKLNVFQPGSTGEFREALTYMDLAIAKALLVPNLLGLSAGPSAGAFAQSQTQLEAYFMTIADDSARLEDAINEQLFNDVGRMNWGDDDYPRFQFKPASAEHIKWIVSTWKDLVGANAVQTTESDEKHLRKLLDMPMRGDDDKLIAESNLELQQKFAPAPGPDGGSAEEGAAGDAKKPVSDKKEAPFEDTLRRVIGEVVGDRLAFNSPVSIQVNGPTPSPISPTPSTQPGDSGNGKAHPHGPRFVGKIAFTTAAARVDFALIDKRSTMIGTDTVEQVARLAARATRKLLADDRMAELTDQNTEDIGQLEIESADRGKIKAGFKTGLAKAWAEGGASAKRELAKSRELPGITFKDLRDNAAEYFESNGFRMAGNLTDGMKAVIQQELLQAVKSGRAIEDTVATIYDRLIRRGFTTLAAVQNEETRIDVIDKTEALLADYLGTANVPAYLETLVRTNTFEALNEARYAAFSDPDLEGFTVAYEYSAVMDSSTTEFCQAMDDKVYAADSDVWDSYRPPNHYNCRSVLIPIFATDGWDGVESAPPTVEPADGFS
jgi:SPP1 gp7 family putative phage head morphogenesis protein